MELNWAKFEAKFEHVDVTLRYQFEILCRRLFKYRFSNVEVWPNPLPNNPGLEMPPAYDEESDKMVGFQAKYFRDSKLSTTQYRQIEESLQTAVKYYVEDVHEAELRLSVLYLYCNRSIDTNNDHFQRINRLLKKNDVKLVIMEDQTLLDEIANYSILKSDFFEITERYNNRKSYYDEICAELEEDSDNAILGRESLVSAYIPPITQTTESGEISMINEIEDWFNREKSDVLLLYGNPGFGKTTFCKKCVYDYVRNRRFSETRGVLWFSLNNNTSLIKGDKVALENTFCYKVNQNLLELRTEGEKVLVLLDGYDEVKMQLQETEYYSFQRFYRYLKRLSKVYGIHFIVTSRTNAVREYINDSSIEKLEFYPLKYEQQEAWIYREQKKHKKEISYWTNFWQKICISPPEEKLKHELYLLMQVPLIFRMLVRMEYSNSDSTQNLADLYEKLLEETATSRRNQTATFNGITKKVKELYPYIAYEIWTYNDDLVKVPLEDEKDGDEMALIYSYYIHGSMEYNDLFIGFIHRSIYQYFLAKYIYQQLLQINNESKAELFLQMIADRLLEYEVLSFLGQIVTNYIKERKIRQRDISQSCLCLLSTLCDKEGFIDYSVSTSEENELENQIDFRKGKRKNNAICNGINICFFCEQVDVFNQKKDEMKTLLQEQKSLRLYIHGTENNLVDMSGIQWNNVSLNGSIFEYVDLTNANLKRCLMEGVILRHSQMDAMSFSWGDFNNGEMRNCSCKSAILTGSLLENCKFSETDLSGALIDKALLKSAQMEGTDLSEVNFSRSEIIHTTFAGFNESEERRYKNTSLNKAVFHNAYLLDTHFHNASLDKSDFRWSSLKNVSFKEIELLQSNDYVPMFDYSAFENVSFEDKDEQMIDLSKVLFKDNL